MSLNGFKLSEIEPPRLQNKSNVKDFCSVWHNLHRNCKLGLKWFFWDQENRTQSLLSNLPGTWKTEVHLQVQEGPAGLEVRRQDPPEGDVL